ERRFEPGDLGGLVLRRGLERARLPVERLLPGLSGLGRRLYGAQRILGLGKVAAKPLDFFLGADRGAGETIAAAGRAPLGGRLADRSALPHQQSLKARDKGRLLARLCAQGLDLRAQRNLAVEARV